MSLYPRSDGHGVQLEWEAPDRVILGAKWGREMKRKVKDAEGDVQERAVQPANTLHAIVNDKKDRVNG